MMGMDRFDPLQVREIAARYLRDLDAPDGGAWIWMRSPGSWASCGAARDEGGTIYIAGQWRQRRHRIALGQRPRQGDQVRGPRLHPGDVPQ